MRIDCAPTATKITRCVWSENQQEDTCRDSSSRALRRAWDPRRKSAGMIDKTCARSMKLARRGSRPAASAAINGIFRLSHMFFSRFARVLHLQWSLRSRGLPGYMEATTRCGLYLSLARL